MEGGSLTVADAAARLDVQPRHVRDLIAAGDIVATRHGRSWAVDPTSINDYRRRRRPTVGRNLSPRMAWAALLSALGTNITNDLVDHFDLHRRETSRLRTLSERNPTDWVWLARPRAATERFETYDAYLDRVAATDGVARTGISAVADHGIDLADHRATLDVYAAIDTVADLKARLRLEPSTTGNLTLRSVALDDPQFVLHRAVMPLTVVAVDLLDDGDSRTARAGLETIETIRRGR